MDIHDTEIKKKIVDCRGLACPLPILHVRLALNTMQAGEVLEILADDPTFAKDFAQFCHLAQVDWIATESCETFTRYQIRVIT